MADATAREQQELANALEAETIVLRQRVIELSATVDRMQQEIVAAQALQAARLAAEEAAKASPQATISRWWGDGWPILAMAVGLALLLAAGLLAMRRRRGVADTPVWMPPLTPDHPPAPARPAPRPAAGASSVARAAAQAAQARQGPDTRGGQATAVAVSELSHVTEEAGVYLAFNRMDRAIEVLQQHIRSAGGSLPAAWLMLLDLYRKQGRDQDFRELAQDFHLRFNAAVPAWDNFATHDEADSGLDAFPHIIRQLVSSWGTAECRALLDRLLHDNRDGRRTGFSLPAYEDILFLRQLADSSSVDAGTPAAAQRAPRPPTAAARRPARPRWPPASCRWRSTSSSSSIATCSTRPRCRARAPRRPNPRSRSARHRSGGNVTCVTAGATGSCETAGNAKRGQTTFSCSTARFPGPTLGNVVCPRFRAFPLEQAHDQELSQHHPFGVRHPSRSCAPTFPTSSRASARCPAPQPATARSTRRPRS